LQQELGDDGRDSFKVIGSSGAAQIFGEAWHAHPSGKASGIHFFRARNEHKIDPRLRKLFDVARFVARIALEVFLWPELGGIDEDRGDHAPGVALGHSDQRQMPGM